MPRTAWLIDGMAYVFRSFYGMPPMAAPDGTPINAVYGLGMTLQKFLAERKPDLLACCFDAGAHTFRNEMYPAYKANRSETPADLIPQFDICRELVARMGIATVTSPGFEADDLIATLTVRLRNEGHEVVIVTGDKDLAQLVGPGVRILDLARDLWWEADGIPARLGVRADQVVDLLALTGDAVDNIPGVRGVGPKAAAALLKEFRNLEAIYDGLDRVENLPIRGARGLRGKLETGRENAWLSHRLASVRTDATCAMEIDQMGYTGAEAADLDAFAEKWGLRAVASRTPRR
jgi:5'-3' exonuclease